MVTLPTWNSVALAMHRLSEKGQKERIESAKTPSTNFVIVPLRIVMG